MNDCSCLGEKKSFGWQTTIKESPLSADEGGWHLIGRPISENPNY
jgi:hypothetical protein